MAEENHGGGGHPMEVAFFLIGGLAILTALWFVNGGPQRADLRGIFLNPPAPVGPGGAYGPQVGQPAPWSPTSTQQ